MMTARIIDGKSVAASIKRGIGAEIQNLKGSGLVPGLATILIGSDPGSQVYVKNKIKSCEALGIKSFHHTLPAETRQEQVLKLIGELNENPEVHGILVQQPFPKGFKPEDIVMAVDPNKDVDGFHPLNVGKFMVLKSWETIEQSDVLLPCTPYGIIRLLQINKIPIPGAHAVVVGRSNLVGKPVAALLASCNATVTLCHSKTKNLPGLCQDADILIVAIGSPKFMNGKMVKRGSAVIDVGINWTKSGLCGDVDFESAKDVAGWITPVPGGVGPMTVTMLLSNTLKAAKTSRVSLNG